MKVGEHFSSYSLKEFEEVFLRFFIRYPNEHILLTNLIKSVFSEVKSNERYYEKIVSTDPVQEYFKKSWIRHLFGGYLLTPSGKAALSQLSAEMEEAILTINKLLANKDVAIRELLLQINGNVFLLQGISLDLLKEVDTSFNEHYPKDQYNGCSGCSIWDSYVDISDGIDSGCSGCSGCGGDGGCSGCGGCGGGD
ncbi:MAG: hypothetical protein K1X55_09420 [Chitinophagales bacterium]|nr:hypothetical protein [Chitinophagales bacterium]